MTDIPLPQPSPRAANFVAAMQAMQLTPQEQALYQMHLQNLYGPGGVDNPDGSRSTLYQAVIEHNGKFYNIPTVWNGKIVPVPQAVANAHAAGGLDAFPSYATPEQADTRYQQMHGFMEKDTGAYFAQQNAAPAPAQPTTRLQNME